MARFQAQTSAVLDAELEDLRAKLGLRSNQKAELLREMTAIMSWVVKQAAEGKVILARGEDGTQELVSPVLARLQEHTPSAALEPLTLDDHEVTALAELLERPFEPPPELVACLERIASKDRRPPTLSWPE